MVNVFTKNNRRIPDQRELEEICNEEWEAFLDTPNAADKDIAEQMQYDAAVIQVLLQNYIERYYDEDMQKQWVILTL